MPVSNVTVNEPGRYGGPKLRDGLIVAFFKQAPFDEWASDVLQVFELFEQTIPAGSLAHILVGANASRDWPYSARTRARALGQFDPSKAAQRRISSVEGWGPQPVNADYHFDMWGGVDAQAIDGNGATNYVHFRFPTAFCGENGDLLASFARNVAELLPFDSGYASPALHWSTEGELLSTRTVVPGIALRHPGFDVHDHSSVRYELGRRCIGPRWLTFLGHELLETLGGVGALETALGENAVVEAFDRGVQIRISTPPNPGDVNTGDNLPELHALAKLLEPVTHFAEGSKLFPSEGDAFERWQQRFLDEWRS